MRRLLKRVHVGIDGSSPSRAALRWGARYAADFDLPLVLENVIDDAATDRDSDARADQLSHAEALLHEARATVADAYCGLEVSVHVLVGEVARSLADECADDELLVIGTHKTGFLRGRAFGSRAFAVVTATRGWVAVVPEDHRSSRTGVVVGVPPAQWQAAVAAGAQIAARGHQSLTLLASTTSEEEAATAPELIDALAVAREHAPRDSIRAQVSRRHLADTVLDGARGAQLLVLPEPRRTEDSAYLGSLTHDVLLNITCPVLLVR